MAKQGSAKGATAAAKKATPNRTSADIVYARIDPVIGKRFRDYMKSLKPKSSMKEHLEVAIAEYLASRFPSQNP